MNRKGILIFNQNGSDLHLLSSLLKARDCTIFFTSLPLEAIHILKANNIDLVLASAPITGMTGQEFKELVESIRPGVSTFLLPRCLTPREGDGESAPLCAVNLNEFVQFIQNHIRSETFAVNESVKFKEFFFAFTHRLLQLFEVKDNYFFNNDQIVADYSEKVARKMNLEENLVDAIHLASLLKDLGKIGIQHELLNNNHSLQTDDLHVVKCHPEYTVQLLQQVNFPWDVTSIIRHHHEHYNGNGYPDGLKGRQIPLGSRIIAIADSYVAMTTDRPYRNARSPAEATDEIMKKAGAQFDPEAVEIFISIMQQEMTLKPFRQLIFLYSADEILTTMIKLNLDSDEFMFYVTADRSDALSHLHSRPPQLIIIDTDHLQEAAGNLYQTIRREPPLNAIPLLLLLPEKSPSGNSDDPLQDCIRKPVDLDRLRIKIHGMLHKTPETAPKKTAPPEVRGIAGNLEEMSLTDIIQLLNMGLKTARISLTADGAKGEIYLRAGKIVSAKSGSHNGLEAFIEMVSWDKGIFRIYHGETTDIININMDTMKLLLEASKTIDEQLHHRQKTGHIE